MLSTPGHEYASQRRINIIEATDVPMCARFMTVNVISTSNKLLFAQAANVAKVLLSVETDHWERDLSKDELVQSLVSTVKDDSHKKLVRQKFLSCPPPFVATKEGFEIQKYIEFINEILKM